jgi:hypothetical protein
VRRSGVDVGDSEDQVFWTAFVRTSSDRGLKGVPGDPRRAQPGATRRASSGSPTRSTRLQRRVQRCARTRLADHSSSTKRAESFGSWSIIDKTWWRGGHRTSTAPLALHESDPTWDPDPRALTTFKHLHVAAGRLATLDTGIAQIVVAWRHGIDEVEFADLPFFGDARGWRG